MANAKIRFQGYIITLIKPLGDSSPFSCQLGHMTPLLCHAAWHIGIALSSYCVASALFSVVLCILVSILKMAY